MALPKKKKSQAKTAAHRSANDKIRHVRNVAYCSRCSAPKLPHRVCPSCGYYKNRQVIEVKEYEA
jgi:large subunit ribosomal protein L32